MFSYCALSYPKAGQPRYLVLGCGAGHQNPTVAISTHLLRLLASGNADVSEVSVAERC